MRCSTCGFDNPEGMKFCGECGTLLMHRCPQCGFENPSQFKFCGACGTSLSRQSLAPTASRPKSDQDTQDDSSASGAPLHAGRGAPEAERRQLTVLFCDLVGSTALAAHLDPEDLREVIRAYQAACTEVIGRFGGHIAQYLGDGLLVYFGYPLAHEDDAQRAVRTGLGMIEAMGPLNAQLQQDKGVQLAVRVGIHTGLVVVGEMGGDGQREPLALGETPDVAARLQDLASSDTVVISAATHRLVQGYFTYQDLGLRSLKGIATPAHLYRVLGESGAQNRLEVTARAGLTPLVGREQEVSLLLERWAQVKDGMGQVLLLNGEAGIGKSRLVQVLKEHLAGETHARLEWRCSPYHRHSALHPVIEHLHRLLRWRHDDGPQEKLHMLEGALARYGFSLPDVMPLFTSLLVLPLPDHYPPLTLMPQRQKQKTLEALLEWLLEEAKRQPLLLIVEDLHWVDPSTLELLNLLIDRGSTARILTLLTCRPEFRSPWGFRGHLTEITLSRLPHAQVEVMVARVAGSKVLPAEVTRQVVAKTDGVPLFVEELTKMVLESDWLQERESHYQLTGPLPPLAIPTTLQDSLMARLDRLGATKAVGQLGATLGRNFAYTLLQAVCGMDEMRLQHALAALVQAELLYQQGAPPQATYRFRHALIQDAAYQSLLKSRRQQYHQRIAQVLAAQFPELGETQPELLAHHYTEAGLSAQAIVYWQRAGQRALERSAHAEAIAHLTTGLALLTSLPETPERTRRDLVLHITLGTALIATRGYAAPEVEQAYARARELVQQVGETPELFPVLFGLRLFYQQRAEFQTARELEEKLFSLAQCVQDPTLLLISHQALGTTSYWLGELAQARAHLEQGIALYDPQQHRSLTFGAIQHPAVTCLAFVARALWMSGLPDQALQQSHKALTLAQELAHPFSLAYALGCAAVLHQLRREGQAAQTRAEAAMALAREQGFALWWAMGTILQGWALAAQGQPVDGVAQIRQGLAAYQATGTAVAQSYLLALLAEAYGDLGQAETGLTVVAEALATVETTGERFYEAELYRLRGELLLKQAGGEWSSKNFPTEPSRAVDVGAGLKPAPTEAGETCFHQALYIARRQQAKSWELRTAISLSRLWRQQGKRDEARQLLAEIYGWFTEGFDTADLQEAEALLEALAS
jgi:predicted ATPase/class 3 adenylate cyclase